MSSTLALNIDQLKMLIGQCPIEEKVELIRFLEKETFEVRFRKLLQQLKSNKIELDEITSEVESIRQRRYERSN
jgi:ribosomal protein L29